MAYQLNGHEFEQTPRDSEGQSSLACCSPWGHRVGHDFATEQQPQGISNLSLHALIYTLVTSSFISDRFSSINKY